MFLGEIWNFGGQTLNVLMETFLGGCWVIVLGKFIFGVAKFFGELPDKKPVGKLTRQTTGLLIVWSRSDNSLGTLILTL